MGHFSKKSPLVKLRYHLYNIHPKSKKWQCLLLCSWNWQKRCVNHDKNIRDAQKLPKYLMSYSVSQEHTFHEYIKVQTIQFLWHLLNFRAKSQPSAFDLLHISKYFIFNTVSRTNKNSNWTRNVKLDFKRKQKMWWGNAMKYFLTFIHIFEWGNISLKYLPDSTWHQRSTSSNI